jgi:large subunit ribosomal protein L18
MSTTKSAELFARRQRRARFKLRQVSGGKPRLSVFRSEKHIYAQLIDDLAGRTVASASSLEKDIGLAKGTDKAAAQKVGQLVAERAIKAGVTEAVFDRGGYIFHGRVKAVADAAREAGLKI